MASGSASAEILRYAVQTKKDGRGRWQAALDLANELHSNSSSTWGTPHENIEFAYDALENPDKPLEALAETFIARWVRRPDSGSSSTSATANRGSFEVITAEDAAKWDEELDAELVPKRQASQTPEPGPGRAVPALRGCVPDRACVDCLMAVSA